MFTFPPANTSEGNVPRLKQDAKFMRVQNVSWLKDSNDGIVPAPTQPTPLPGGHGGPGDPDGPGGPCPTLQHNNLTTLQPYNFTIK